MEEIDIIELLKRVKEGKAPKRIEINGNKYFLRDLEKPILDEIYYTEDKTGFALGWIVCIDTKIKILDKPIIEELEIKDEGNKYFSPDTFEITAKVNEIIKFINEKN